MKQTKVIGKSTCHNSTALLEPDAAYPICGFCGKMCNVEKEDHKIEPLDIEEYIEHVRYPDRTLDYEELNYEKAVRALFAKINEIVDKINEKNA